MPEDTIDVGDVVQIDPEHDSKFGGCFMIVTDYKGWGAVGYVQVPGVNGGQAYYRCPNEAMKKIGRAEWVTP